MNDSFWRWFFKWVKAVIICFFKFSWLRSTTLECVVGVTLLLLGSFVTWAIKLYWLIPLCIIVGITLFAHGVWRYNRGE